MTQPDPLQQSYEAMLYPVLSYRQTHPGRLAMIATLLGLEAASVEHCRVLELGCASGGNLIPMAYQLPKSHFVGVDFGSKQIAEGQELIDALGLENIELHAMDILDITPEFGTFDYIIAHGLFSWVPPHVQAQVLKIAKANLAPHGVAYISYNCLPGWHMLRLTREMMLYHTADIDDPAQKVEAALDFVGFVQEHHVRTNNAAYSAFLNTYSEVLHIHERHARERESASIYHDEMETHNSAFYFRDFMAQAKEAGLQYLAEANFAEVMPTSFAPDVQQKLNELAGERIMQMEQYMDFLRNRTFRKTLLVHDDITINRRLNLRPIVVQMQIAGFAAPLLEEGQSPDDLPMAFKGSDEALFRTDHPVSRAAFLHLYETSPQSYTFEELIEAALARLGLSEGDAEDAQALALNILRTFTYSQHLIELSTHKPAFTLNISESPIASALARLLAQKQKRVINLRHERVDLDPIAHALLPYLDGEHDHEALISILQGYVDQGLMRLSKDEQAITDPLAVYTLLSRQVDVTLNWLARAALLEA